VREFTSTAAILFQLVRYHGSVFLKKLKAYPPLALWVFAVYLIFEPIPPPTNVVQAYAAASMWLFFAIVWFGYMFLSDFDTVTEHLLILQTNSRVLYSASKILFMIAVCLVFSLFGSAYPLILEFAFGVMGYTFIADGMGFVDFLGGFLLHVIVGTLGISVAFLFQPSPSKRYNHLEATVLALFTLMAFIKHDVLDFEIFQGFLRYVLLVFTPVHEILTLFSGRSVFAARDLIFVMVSGGIYFALAVIVGYWLYNKRVYSPHLAKNAKKVKE